MRSGTSASSRAMTRDAGPLTSLRSTSWPARSSAPAMASMVSGLSNSASSGEPVIFRLCVSAMRMFCPVPRAGGARQGSLSRGVASSGFVGPPPRPRVSSLHPERRGGRAMHERRTNRSEIPEEAARLFLQAAVERHGLHALCLANEHGLLIAAAAAPGAQALDLGWIAALGSVCAIRGRRGPSLGALVERVTGGHHLHSAEIVLRGERLYVASVGGPLPPGRALA